MKKLLSCFALTLLLAVSALPATAQEDAVERPTTESLLPETTVVFVQIENIREFFEKMQETGFGQAMQHPEVEGMINGLFDEAKLAYDDVKESVGLELEDIQEFPGGEISFAIVAPKRDDLQYALMLEIDEESEAVQNVLNRGREFIEEQGEEIESNDTGEVVFDSFRADGTKFTTFIKDGLFVSASSEELAQQLVDRWMGREVEKIRPLTDNRKFVTVMNRCRGTKDLPPEMRFFIDPIELARGITRGNMGAQAIINFLPILGLDGLSAIGGSAILDELGFESVGHVHVMLANPRAGIIKMIALKPGEYKPETWIPEDATAYISSSWDIDQAMAELEKIIDTFQGEGAFQSAIEEGFNEEVGFDLKEDVLSQFTGRVTYTSWINFPANISSQVQVGALELTDPDAFEELRLALFEKAEEEGDLEDIEEVVYKGVSYWTEPEENREARRERRAERARQNQEEGRVTFQPEAPQLCVGVIGNSLVICSSPKFMERAIDTERGEFPALVDNEEFSETTDTMVKLLKNDMPGAVFFQRPAAGMEMMFDLASEGGDFDTMLKMMRQEMADDEDPESGEPGTGRRFANGVQRVMEENRLPSFDEVRGYFAPSGGFITNDDTGYHLMTFQLKYDRDN